MLMTTIGLISDTHSYLDEQVFKHFADCDEIWHSGDIGYLEIIEKLQNFKPTRFVYGNIDSKQIQWEVPENQHFEIENLKVWMTHIGGIPPNYNSSLKKVNRTSSSIVCLWTLAYFEGCNLKYKI